MTSALVDDREHFDFDNVDFKEIDFDFPSTDYRSADLTGETGLEAIVQRSLSEKMGAEVKFIRPNNCYIFKLLSECDKIDESKKDSEDSEQLEHIVVTLKSTADSAQPPTRSLADVIFLHELDSFGERLKISKASFLVTIRFTERDETDDTAAFQATLELLHSESKTLMISFESLFLSPSALGPCQKATKGDHGSCGVKWTWLAPIPSDASNLNIPKVLGALLWEDCEKVWGTCYQQAAEDDGDSE